MATIFQQLDKQVKKWKQGAVAVRTCTVYNESMLEQAVFDFSHEHPALYCQWRLLGTKLHIVGFKDMPKSGTTIGNGMPVNE